jgi:hypothetical protein
MRKGKMFFLVLLISLFAVCSVYCDELTGNRSTQTVDGSVTKVDFVGNTVLVNTVGGQLPFSVSDATMIRRGTDKISLEDVEIGDPVTVEFYSPSPGIYLAVAIVDNNMANE